jgi:hypothetical protein
MVSVFGIELTDSFITSYLISLGSFNYDNYGANDSKVYLWIYFIFSTALTQIIFFNMLVTVMATTYSDVMENCDRQKLISETMILAKLSNILPVGNSRLKEKRYIYVAKRNPDVKDTNSKSNPVLSKRSLDFGF